MTQPPGGPGQPQGPWGPPPPGYGPQGYGPQGYGSQGYGPPGYGPPPKKKHTARNVILAVVGVLLVIGIISSAAGSKNTTNTPAASSPAPAAKSSAPSGTSKDSTTGSGKNDVTISSCTTDPTLNYPTAKVRITNNSSKRSNYLVTVSFIDKTTGDQITTGVASADNLEPGQATSQDAGGTVQASGKFTCTVADVTRYAS